MNLTKTATDRELLKAQREGFKAAERGEHRAPGLNGKVRDMIADAPVGEPRTLQILQAFSTGYDAALELELARMMEEWSA